MHRLFTPNIGGRIGFSYLSLEKDFIIPEVIMYFFPLSFNYFVGNGSSKLELGAGITFVTGQFDWFGLKSSGSIVIANFNIGYRYQPIVGGLLFRIGFNPVVTPNGVKPWGGLSTGLAF